MLNFKQCTLRRGSRVLFQDATFTIHRGERVGITGVNGCGKSSLFALLRGELHADSGDFEMPPNLAIAHVAQETPALSKSAIDYVIDGDAELRRVEASLAQAEHDNDGNRQALLHAQLENIGGYTARNRAAQLLSGLGFLPGQEESPVSSFSGGWRMRLNLAQALMCRSDLLLLDEPTNHLDLDAVIWLQQWLGSYPGTLLLISHDRDFLDDVTTHIAHIEQQRIELYTGNYTDFERRRAEKLAQQQSAYQKQQREVAHIQSYISRFRAQATKARQAQSRIKALERMELIAAAHVDSPFNFSFRDPEKLPSQLLQLNKVSIGYGDTPILSNVKLHISSGDRIGLLGANGAGKSTLIKVLSGKLKPLCVDKGGEFNTAQDLKLGYFAQHQLEQLDPEASAMQHLLRLDPKASDADLRSFIGGFAFNGDMATTPIAPFSGGEKARLALALLVYQRPNLLLLDEPTNHLDLEMREALGMALQDYKGALVVISHDRHLLRNVCDTLLLVKDGAVQEFDGDLDDYRQLITSASKSAVTDEKSVGENGNAARKDKKRLEAERRQQLKPLRDKVKKLEQQMEKLQSQKSAIEAQLADPAIYGEANKTKLKELLAQQTQTTQTLDQVEGDWLEASEALEQLESES
jgi:ATP-binding cassette subfamily F protein 3